MRSIIPGLIVGLFGLIFALLGWFMRIQWPTMVWGSIMGLGVIIFAFGFATTIRRAIGK